MSKEFSKEELLEEAKRRYPNPAFAKVTNYSCTLIFNSN